MAVNYVERALEHSEYMLRAKAALQLILRDRYHLSVDDWKEAIRDEMTRNKKSPIETALIFTDTMRDHLHVLMVLSAALDIIQDDYGNLPSSHSTYPDWASTRSGVIQKANT
jgi:hypothetical protein